MKSFSLGILLIAFLGTACKTSQDKGADSSKSKESEDSSSNSIVCGFDAQELEIQSLNKRERESFQRTFAPLTPNDRKILDFLPNEMTVQVVFNVVLSDNNSVDLNVYTKQLDILNSAFNGADPGLAKVNPYWQQFPFWPGNPRIRFVAFPQDFIGQSVNGVRRVKYTGDKPLKDASSAIKQISPFQLDKVLNIYVADFSFYGSAPIGTNGPQVVCIDFQTLPGISPRNTYNSGKTLVHEIGHFFGLFHAWGKSDELLESNCSSGDGINDTPPMRGPSDKYRDDQLFCGVTSGSPNQLFKHNYMDYTNDDLRCIFSHGQSERMRVTAGTTRASYIGNLSSVTSAQIERFEKSIRRIK